MGEFEFYLIDICVGWISKKCVGWNDWIGLAPYVKMDTQSPQMITQLLLHKLNLHHNIQFLYIHILI